jgi:hypothetical protein
LKVQCSLGSSPQQPRSSQPLEPAGQLDEQQERSSKLVVLSSKLPNQADQLWDPSDRNEDKLIVLEKPATRSISDLDYLSVSAVFMLASWRGARQASMLTCYATTAGCAAGAAVCLQELLAIQQNDGPKNLGFFGTRNMGMTHQKLVEILGYAMVSTVSAAVSTGTTAQHSALLCSRRGRHLPLRNIPAAGP